MDSSFVLSVAMIVDKSHKNHSASETGALPSMK